MKSKLVAMIKEQLARMLTKIEESSESDINIDTEEHEWLNN